MTQIRRILFASDFSKASAKAFATTGTLAKGHRADVTILHVFTPFVPTAPEQYLAAEALDRLNLETRRWSQRQLAKLTDKARTSGIRAAGLILEGDPAQQIVRTAKSKRADLIVVGTHGRTGLNKLFLGSVAQRVVATAPCPVVIVRGK